MVSDHVVYRERTPWATWVTVVVWGAFVAGAYPILLGSNMDLPFERRFVLAACIISIAAVVHVFFGGTTVLVETRAVRVHLGRLPVVSKRILYEDILGLESVRYHPIKEFGGWGVRFGRNKQAWTARGDQAVVLRLAGGRELYIGSDHPRRLEDRIRMAAGDHLASSAPRA